MLTMTGITKQFPGVMALQDVDFRLFPGEVHALMGENGAGKSTLIKVLTGVYSNDAGEIVLDGAPVRFAGPLQATQAGISTVFQEVNLCANLSVAENIFIGREPTWFGHIRWGVMRRRAAELPTPGDRHRRHRPARRVFARRAADGGDRPGHRRRGEGPRPGRADLQPRRR